MAINVSALDFTFDYPETIELEEEFEVTINADTQEIYDVKIFVHDDVKASSEIMTGEGWKSTHYYLQDIFPEQKTFTLIAHIEADTEICVRMRLQDSSNYDESCLQITVESSESENQEQEEDQEDQANQQQEEHSENQEPKEPNEMQEPETQQLSQNNEKIILSSPKKESEQDSFNYDKRIWILISFSIFTIFIIILLALRKL